MLRSHARLIAIICLISSIARFVLDSYLPSMPAIQDYFGLSAAAIQWTMTDYLLGFGLSQLVYGPLSDRFGRRPVMIGGMLIFLSGCLLAAMTSVVSMLFLSRIISGIGAGACGVLNRAIASDAFEGSDFSRAWSYTTTSLVLTLILAPVIGSIVQHYLGWRSNFMLATLLVAIILLCVWRFLPETLCKTKITSALSLGGIFSVYWSLLISPAFFLGTACYTLAFSGLILYFQLSPLLYMNILHFSAIQYGLSSTLIALSYLAGGLFVSRAAKAFSRSSLILFGAVLLISGGVLMVCANSIKHVEGLSILLPTAIYVLGARIIIPNAIASGMNRFRHINGSSSALMGFIQMVGSSLISFLLSCCKVSSAIPLGVFFCVLGCGTFLLAIQARRIAVG